MITQYKSFMKQLMPDFREDLVNINGIRHHLYKIMARKGWSMVKPKTIELKRCGIYCCMKK